MKCSTNLIIAILLALSAILTVSAMCSMREGMDKEGAPLVFKGGLRALAGSAPKEVVNRHTTADEILDGQLGEYASAESTLDCDGGSRSDLSADASYDTSYDGSGDSSDCNACKNTWCGMEGSSSLLLNLPDDRDRRIKGTLLVPHSIP